MFKVGQEVWCLLNGKGKVTYIDPHCIYEIGVTFPIGQEIFFTADGFLDVDHVHRSLYFSEPVVQGAEKPPFVPTLVGKKVLVEISLTADLYFCDVVCETEDKIYVEGEEDIGWMKENVRIYEIQEVTFKE